MTMTIALLLGQDGLTNGAIYALIGIVLVMVFSVTRVILVAQGEFVSFAALTLAGLRNGATPGTLWLMAAGAALAAGLELVAHWRNGTRHGHLRAALTYAAVPLIVTPLTLYGAPHQWPYELQIVLTLAIVVPLGPILYRLVFRPVEEASILVLLLMAVALHLALTGAGLMMFGPEGVRTPALIAGRVLIGPMRVSYQSIVVLGVVLGVIVALVGFFGFTREGKALRATAQTRIGARLVGIATARAGTLVFSLAAGIGAISGILIAPVTTVYYDTGFLIGLKGFVAAIVGGLGSYPLAALGAIAIGLLESFSAFFASNYKEVIVFTAIIPILVWRNLVTAHSLEEEEE